MKLLITGGCGFLGSNLAASALHQGIELKILDNLSRFGSRENLAWLRSHGRFLFDQADIRDADAVARCVSTYLPDAVFHLAGQVAMTTSLASPRLDFEINALGTLNILEALRTNVPHAVIFYSSTNKVYGALENFTFSETSTRYICNERPTGFDETTPLAFESPYGCSKGCADQYILDYARMFDLRSAVFRHSSMCGGRQYATVDQGWVSWFCSQALKQSTSPAKTPLQISGTGKQVRDVLHADDMVTLYYTGLTSIDAISGQAFNVGGGMSNSLSLIELFAQLEKLFGVELNYSCGRPRQSDQPVFIADTTRLHSRLGWAPRVNVYDALKDVAEWVRHQHS